MRMSLPAVICSRIRNSNGVMRIRNGKDVLFLFSSLLLLGVILITKTTTTALVLNNPVVTVRQRAPTARCSGYNNRQCNSQLVLHATVTRSSYDKETVENSSKSKNNNNPWFATSSTSSSNTFNRQPKQQLNGSSSFPFIIERLGERPNDETFKEIADMCISVFFNNGKRFAGVPPWKQVQLSYLRTLQTGDLKRRRGRDKNTNAMFVAYEVLPAKDRVAVRSQPLIVDFDQVYNLPRPQKTRNTPSTSSFSFFGGRSNNNNNDNNIFDEDDIDYVRGDILGFCEVTMQPCALPTTPVPEKKNSNDDGSIYDYDSATSPTMKQQQPKQPKFFSRKRAVLTNLSVETKARKYGVGSKLLQACELATSRNFGEKEIVLEVEDDNVLAQNFYKKRGYTYQYSDPSSRRYDVTGLVLRKVRCTNQILQKRLLPLYTTTSSSSNKMTASTSSFSDDANENMGQKWNNFLGDTMNIFQKKQ